ncbi:MAG: hypothetical protein M3020_24310 [Myxococcota bacterium]|jgi:hypothetical protein|nr:hypothetical protein [Myxococcota bacterium]
MSKFVSSFIAIAAVAGLASACAVDVPLEEQESAGADHQALVNCANPEGTNAMIAAVAVAIATELGRWNVSTDFTTKIGTYNQRHLTLSTQGQAQCTARGNNCENLKALLFFQDAKYDNYIRFPNRVKLSAYSYAARLVAGWEGQRTCEQRARDAIAQRKPIPPDACPAEDHSLTLFSTAPGGCDMNFTYTAKKPDGTPLANPAQLKNKLVWANDGGSMTNLNPYIQFQSTASTVTVDPTWDLNQPGSASGGSCTLSCQKYDKNNVLTGQCCTCNGQSGTFQLGATANVYKCSAGG